MKELLKIEWLKLKGYRTFWVLSALFIISIFGINYFVYYVKQLTVNTAPPVNAIVGTPFSFPNVWHTVSYFSSFLLVIPGLMIITSITNEFTYKTSRQNIIDGWSRTDFIKVKMTLLVLLAAISTLIVFITSIIFGFISASSFTFEKIEYVGFFFIQAISYSMLALLISLFIKRSGLAIGIFFLYSFIIENMLGAFINFATGRIDVRTGPGNFLPLNSVDSLIPFPLFRNIIDLGTSTSRWILLAVAILYLLFYAAISFRKYSKADL
ncbi:MAG: ABC transporter permease subunit [Ginsengibacter sp.]